MFNKQFQKNTSLVIAFTLFFILIGLRLFFLKYFGTEGHSGLIWAMVYNIVAIFGGVCGLYLSNLWGGYKSIIGKAILAFSLGLFAQSFGQNVYSYFYLTQGFDITAPYPSIGDIGYFGSVIFYTYGVFALARASGVSASLNSFLGKVKAFLITLFILIFSYSFLLKGYEFDWSDKLKVFLDFAYPLGQAFYVSIAILLVFMSWDIIGGAIKKPIMFLLFALVAQYFSDFTFLYESNKGIFVAGGIVDFMYFISYFIMTLAIIYIGSTFQKIRFENETVSSLHPEINTTNDKLFNQILVEIIKRQERIAGHLAWEQVRRVENIIVNDEVAVNVSINGNPKQAIDQLVYNFKNLFGDIAVDVSKSAVRYLTAELPSDQVPDSLK